MNQQIMIMIECQSSAWSQVSKLICKTG